MLGFLVLVMIAAVAAGAAAAAAPPIQQRAEKELILTITAPELKGGVLSEITWDGNALMLQGVFAEPSGELKAQYFIVPAERTQLEHRKEQTDTSLEYWRRKSNRLSPTGLGRIELKSDTKLPQFGIGDLERRLGDAVDMGGTQTRTEIRLGGLVMHAREGDAPYDGEVWSWSPAELNRVAYVDANGDLWIARADGRDARRIMRGSFTLPAWSEDGRAIAVAERKDGGRRWEVSLIRLPRDLTSQ
jgi:hypothetical protein